MKYKVIWQVKYARMEYKVIENKNKAKSMVYRLLNLGMLWEQKPHIVEIESHDKDKL